MFAFSATSLAVTIFLVLPQIIVSLILCVALLSTACLVDEWYKDALK